MILVDTCVWIDFLRSRVTPQVQFLHQVQDSPSYEICISGVIYFELLRGIPDKRERMQVQQQLEVLERKDILPGSFEKMLEYDLLCRGRGITLPGVADWLIAQTAIDHNLELLTSDKDFSLILPYVPLKVLQSN